MKITISILYITSAVSFSTIEASSHGSGSSGRSENASLQSYPLNFIPGLKIPSGEQLRHRHQIIAVNQNGVVVPYFHLDSFTILKPTGRKCQNDSVVFQPVHVSEDEWLLYVAAYARAANRPWVLDSAIHTITELHLYKVEAQRATDPEAQNAGQHGNQVAAYRAATQNRRKKHQINSNDRGDSSDLGLARFNINTHPRISTSGSGFESSTSEYQGTPRPLTTGETRTLLNDSKNKSDTRK
ncbi:uncharacterized protein LOC117173934 [Belonocnema kinseyi]|uniref:uncharacterized protein LOC117173934 n=1 Tax=Belonocnema kinseyi TaxID=2817044 RepID=UPI00143CE9EA|nr:uncharacterized protein LOC117173934 [Belonocnema kinseyi]